MNDQLQKELAAWLTQLRGGADLVIGQAPAIIQERIAYGKVSEVFALLVAVALAAASIWFLRKGFDWMREDDNPLGVLLGPLGVLLGSLAVVFNVIWVAFQIDACFKVWFAPRIYVIEWLSQLIK